MNINKTDDNPAKGTESCEIYFLNKYCITMAKIIEHTKKTM